MQTGSPKKILIVEDDQYIQESMAELLTDEGYEVNIAQNGKIALDFLRAQTQLPNLILLDLMMPIMDGFAFREQQVQDARLNTVPVVIMSADGNIAEKKARTTAKEYIRKPVEIDALLTAIKTHMN